MVRPLLSPPLPPGFESLRPRDHHGPLRPPRPNINPSPLFAFCLLGPLYHFPWLLCHFLVETTFPTSLVHFAQGPSSTTRGSSTASLHHFSFWSRLPLPIFCFELFPQPCSQCQMWILFVFSFFRHFLISLLGHTLPCFVLLDSSGYGSACPGSDCHQKLWRHTKVFLSHNFPFVYFNQLVPHSKRASHKEKN